MSSWQERGFAAQAQWEDALALRHSLPPPLIRDSDVHYQRHGPTLLSHLPRILRCRTARSSPRSPFSARSPSLPRSNHLLAAKPRFALARLATPLQCMLCYAMLCYAMQCYAMLCNAMQCKNANPNAWCSGSARLGLFRSLLSQVPLADGATLDSITREARVDVPRALQVPEKPKPPKATLGCAGTLSDSARGTVQMLTSRRPDPSRWPRRP
jgi:hypothetical protein